MYETAEEAIAWLTRRMPQHGMKFGLDRMEAMLERLAHPQRRLRFIHVAGTNGKGSTCVFLAHILQEAGYEVGLFTSPYIQRFTNRIQVNGQDISDHVLVDLVNTIKPLAEEVAKTHGEVTMFECSTLVALLYFARVACVDVVVWETGLGGRLDATNVVVPLVSIITTIGYDHQDVLGETLPLIAAEKAGIIKGGVSVVTAVSQPEAWAVIAAKANEKKANLYTLGTQFSIDTRHMQDGLQRFDFVSPFGTLHDMHITLNGQFQQMNAALALMTTLLLRNYYAFHIEEQQMRAGLSKTTWRGRLETIAHDPHIVLDGAHNPEGAQALVTALRTFYTYERLIVVVAMIDTKDHAQFFVPFVADVDVWVVTQPAFFKKQDAHALADVLAQTLQNVSMSPHVTVISQWETALKHAQTIATAKDLIVVTGSLYFLADARAHLLQQQPQDKGW